MNYRENAFNAPIRIDYRSPKSILYLQSLSHSGALICLFFVFLPLRAKDAVILCVLTSYCHFYLDFKKQSNALSCPQLCLSRENAWSLNRSDGESISMQLRPSALVHHLGLVLRFRAGDGSSHSFVLSKENVESNILRRLRVRLKHAAQKT